MIKIACQLTLFVIITAITGFGLSPTDAASGEECDRIRDLCQALENKAPGNTTPSHTENSSEEKPKFVSYACNTGTAGIGACETNRDCPEGTSPHLVVPTSVIEGRGSGALGQNIQCWGGEEQSTSEIVAAEFAKTRPQVPFPTIQDGGLMLVNWPIVFSSSVTQYDVQTTALGRPVTIRVIPTEYVWKFGDGDKQTTQTPGEPIDIDTANNYDQGYPAYVEKYGKVSHLYLTCGSVSPSLSVTFRGQYSLDGTTFNNISGTVTADSPTEQLRVYQAKAELVDPNQPMPSPKQPCSSKQTQ